jgi:hypothetical protein
MYEEEILKELKMIRVILEKMFVNGREYGGEDFRGCLMRIMFNTDN